MLCYPIPNSSISNAYHETVAKNESESRTGITVKLFLSTAKEIKKKKNQSRLCLHVTTRIKERDFTQCREGAHSERSGTVFPTLVFQRHLPAGFRQC